MSKKSLKPRIAAMLATIGLGAGVAQASDMESTENNVLKVSKETSYDAVTAKKILDTENVFKNLHDVQVEKKQGLSMNQEELKTETYKNSKGSITYYTYANGDTETEFFSENNRFYLKNGKGFDTDGKELSNKELCDKLDKFQKDTHGTSIFQYYTNNMANGK